MNDSKHSSGYPTKYSPVGSMIEAKLDVWQRDRSSSQALTKSYCRRKEWCDKQPAVFSLLFSPPSLASIKFLPSKRKRA